MDSIKMGSIRKLFFIFIFLAFGYFSLQAQSVSLASEISRLEKLAEDPALKKDAFERLARLYQLSGNREKALEYRMSAAEPGKRDDNSVLETVKLLISMGEFEKADAELRTILLSSRDAEVQQSALLLNAELEAFRSGDCLPLAYLTDNPGFNADTSGIFYTLWKISGDDSWKSKILDSFPRSAEAAMLSNSSVIVPAMTVQWLLLPPRISASRPESAAAQSAPPQSAASPPASSPSAAVPPPASQAAAAETAVMLQTGLFNKEDNAKKMADDLAKAGFKSEVTRRLLDGSDYWAVQVPAGSDVNRTIGLLKNSGFESFPVF
ncbi:MAG: SPOR domain-containing protein [Treponema sp.]|nr:SPOR domain-containing protein [Treponema sp.]